MRRALASAAVMVAMVAMSARASADELRVPRDYPSIQAAVDAAEHGDRVLVGPGLWCGATITREVHLFGVGAAIAGCDAPLLFGDLRAGFVLDGPAASGTSVRGFVFDGAGVANDQLEPLAFGVFGRDADDVVVRLNFVRGTVQAITNTRGNGWHVSNNLIVELTAFTCGEVGRCGGGSGIVMQNRVDGERSSDNAVWFNAVAGDIPDELSEFDMTGIVLYGQSHTSAASNRVRFTRRTSSALGIGVLVNDRCCGGDTFSTSEDLFVAGNVAPQADYAVVIAPGNAEGAVVRHNIGTVLVDALPPSLRPGAPVDPGEPLR